MIDTNQLANIVKSAFEDRFDDAEIVSVSVTPDTDEDGDSIFYIKIVFDGKTSKLDSRKASGLIGDIISRFSEAGAEDFPILSFISKSDYRKTDSEVA